MLKYWQSDLFKKTTANAFKTEHSEIIKEEEFDQSPEELVADLKKMGPTYIKMGQLLSTRPDLLPDSYLQALASLQDDCEPIPYKKVHEIIEEELHIRISKSFQEFHEEPLASASIGQVHYAVLRSGKPVAVKIQRPNIKRQFLEDLDTLQEMASLAVKHLDIAKRYAIDDVLTDLRKILLDEVDYGKEKQNLLTLQENLIPFDKLTVPKPINDYCASRVLTMEYIEGKKITSLSPLNRLEHNYTPVVNQLVEAYLQQIINDGFVHADPHPGNIQLTKNGKIALMDLGMVAKFTTTMQESLLQLLIAISNNNGLEVANTILSMSKIENDSNTELFQKTINEFIVESAHSSAKELQTGRLLIQLNTLAAEMGIHIPVDLNILGKILLNMDQIIAILDPEFDLRLAIRKHAKKIMQRKMYDELKPENLFSILLSSKKLLEHTPERLNKITENLADNKFKINIDALDEDRLTDGFQKIANRITLGIIVAAMIVGASLLMQIPTDFTIYGYPGFAMVFFILAAFLGIWLVYVIIFKDNNLTKNK